MVITAKWVPGEAVVWGTTATWLCTLLAVLGLAWYQRRCAYYKKYLGHLPGRRFQPPILGDLIFYVNRLNLDDLWTIAKTEHTEHGFKPFRFWNGEQPVVVISAPEEVAVMLSSTKLIDKPGIGYSAVQSFFGSGLITLNGDPWKQHRKVLTPAFHFQVLDRYVKIFTRRARALADKLHAHPSVGCAGSMDLLPEMSCFVTETIWETAFGMCGAKYLEAPGKKAELLDAMSFIHSVTIKRVFWPLLRCDWIFRLTPFHARAKHAEQLIEDLAFAIIRAKKEELAAERATSQPQEETEEDDVGVKKRDAFLDLVMGQENLTEAEVLQEVRTLLAVQQTSATSLSFTAVLLAIHPEVQEAVRQEVLQIDAQGLDQREALSKMHHLECVIKESLRLFPNTPMIAREAREEICLPDGKTVVPPGCMVAAVLPLTHRNPRHWSDPERFDPDRFLPEHSTDRHPYAFVPFSAGPRNCIGQRYAMLQMKAVLAELLRRFRILPGPGCRSMQELRVSMNLFMYIVGGFNVRFEPVDQS